MWIQCRASPGVRQGLLVTVGQAQNQNVHRVLLGVQEPKVGGESPGLSLQGRGEVSPGPGIPGSSLESRVREAGLGGGVTKAAVFTGV